jgi:hypothetical protein
MFVDRREQRAALYTLGTLGIMNDHVIELITVPSTCDSDKLAADWSSLIPNDDDKACKNGAFWWRYYR